ncbi:MAG TPA: branched-chain amino acid ABC transporter permease [Chloroflexota bacterium]|nr:branched-chain amino acid ABC transporter permease [Chloroflexota bacterium]
MINRGTRAPYEVQRWTTLSYASTACVGALIVALVFVPMVFGTNLTQQLTSLLILVILAVTWNALAGYGGLISVGQQAYIGLGAYGTIYLNQRGVPPYLAMVLAAAGAGVIAVPVSLLVLRLRGGQFAIGTWVVAEAFALLVVLDQSLGGGTGISLTTLDIYSPSARQAYTYWLTLAITVILLAAVFFLLRSRLGTSLRAIRDDEEAAASVGVPVMRTKRVLFILAACGCGAAGALTLASTLFVETQSVFGVQWSAYMIFIVLVGGLGTFEGPILGAIIFYFLQNQFADYGAWYLVGQGATAIAFALFLPRGLWGTVESRFHISLLPVGYILRQVGSPATLAPDRTQPPDDRGLTGGRDG